MRLINRYFTPIIQPERVARWYPGGENLDRMFGKKSSEGSWHFPEAWIFSAAKAQNPGREDIIEGLTYIYNLDGEKVPFSEYLEEHRTEILGEGYIAAGHKDIKLMVKLLDGSCTLPKEFHFMEKDLPILKQKYFKDFNGTIIKPECWIGHPDYIGEKSDSFFGFSGIFAGLIGKRRFASLIRSADISAMENSMNRVEIAPYGLLYLEGGIVHSLGKGLYFEVLAPGDTKITLQPNFAGKELSLADRYGALNVDDSPNNCIARAMGFINFSWFRRGKRLVKRLYHSKQDSKRSMNVSGGKEINALTSDECPYFSVKWKIIPPKEKMISSELGIPHIIIVAGGSGRFYPDQESDEYFTLKPCSSLPEYSVEKTCFAGIVHGSSVSHILENTGDKPLVILCAFPSVKGMP